jgi:hypothetical protein
MMGDQNLFHIGIINGSGTNSTSIEVGTIAVAPEESVGKQHRDPQWEGSSSLSDLHKE